MKRSDSQPGATSATRWTIGLTMAGLAAAGAVISYTDGLFLVHMAGQAGRVALLYPLLPDGLILVSSASLYDAARSGADRPAWASIGIALGALLTLAMNVAAGAAHSQLDALIDGVVPVVFFVALEILIGLIKRGRGGEFGRPAPAACDHQPPLSLDAAIVAAAPHATKRELARTFEVSRARVDKLLPPVPREPEPAGAALNGASA